MIYIIKDWDIHFENNRTREIKNLAWVPVPNKQDGDGYTEIMDDKKNGTAIFGCWIAILELASRCDPRGTLLRGDKTPHNIGSISRITRVPVEILKIAIPKLLTIGWIITYNDTAEDCDITAPSCIEQNRTEQNRVEEKRTELVDEIYKLYPSKSKGRDRITKCLKDKEKIAKILKTDYPLRLAVEIAGTLEYPKDLATFLNHLPDPDTLIPKSNIRSLD